MKLNDGMRQYVPSILPHLIHVMNRDKGPKTLLENTGTCPLIVRNYLGAFFSNHARTIWASLLQRSGALPERVRPAMVSVSTEHQGQRREGVGLPRHLLHDQPEPAGGRTTLHLPV